MATSEARVQANKKNSLLSTGPKTDQGKNISRSNSLKHGMTGRGIVIPEADAAEVERRTGTFAVELKASGDVGMALIRRAALNSVRMERGADQQTVAMTVLARQVEADFVPPEGATEAEAAKLLDEAVRAAMFDPSKEAVLARQYEAAAERGFFRCLKELEKLAQQAKAEVEAEAEAAPQGVSEQEFEASLASYFEMKKMDDEMDVFFNQLDKDLPPLPTNSPHPAPMNGRSEVPISIGRRR